MSTGSEATDGSGAQVGAVRIGSALIDPSPLAALSALFDDGLPVVGPGDMLPPLWHWAALATWDPAGVTGPDGHPRVGGFLPDVGKPRRMFAGGTVEFHAPLVVGEEVERRDEVASVTPKHGRQGDFVLVEVVTELSTSAGLALRETQSLVYRDPPATAPTTEASISAAQPVAPSLLEQGLAGWSLHTDPTKLMRFSSLTSNGHRIHYDLAYATAVEGYPGLVVHGPLLAMAMAETLRLSGARSPHTISHRGLRPLFCGHSAEIVTVASDQERRVVVRSEDGDHATLVARYD